MLRVRIAAMLLAFVAGGLASAADSPLSAFPDSTDVVVRIRAPKTTVDKAASLVEAIQPGFGAMVRQNAAQLGGLISNPTLAGVDQTKDWYIAILTKGQDEPAVVFGIPVTNVDMARKSLGEEMKSTAHGDWLYYSEDESALPAAPAADGALEAAMKGEPATVFDKGDVALFINLAHLVEAYTDQIAGGFEQARQGLSRIPPQPGADPEALRKVYGDIIDHVQQGLRDSVQVTVAMNVGAEGIAFEDYLSFTPRSKTATAIGEQKTSAMELAGRMPPEAVMIFGASGDIQRLIDWGMAMSKGMTTGNEAATKAMEEFTAGINGLRFGSMVGAMAFEKSDNGLVKNVAVTEISDPKKYQQLTRALATSMGTIETQGLKQETKLEADAESYGSLKADVLTVKQEFDASADPTGTARQMQDLMFGTGGMQSRVVYLKDKFVTTVGGGKEAMSEALKALDAPTTSEAVATYRKGLIDSSNILFLVDVPGLAVQGLRFASEIPGLPLNINPAMLDSLKFDKSFMGFAAAAEVDAVRARTRIPVEQLRSIFSLVMTAQAMQQQPQN